MGYINYDIYYPIIDSGENHNAASTLVIYRQQGHVEGLAIEHLVNTRFKERFRLNEATTYCLLINRFWVRVPAESHI